MPFRIFASSGKGGFQYVKGSVRDEADLTDGLAAQAMASAEKTLKGLVGGAKEASDAGASYDGALRTAMAKTEAAHLIKTTIDNLAQNSAFTGTIRLWAQRKNLIGADGSASASVLMDEGDSPGLVFLRRAKPALEATDLWTVGALVQISNALSGYHKWRLDNGKNSDEIYFTIQPTKLLMPV